MGVPSLNDIDDVFELAEIEALTGPADPLAYEILKHRQRFSVGLS
jgi:hypothetical protein